MENKMNKIDALYLTLKGNVEERHQYSIVLSEMEDINKKEVSVCFKMFINHRYVGWEEVKNNEKEFIIPYQLNEQICNLVRNYYSKKIKELEEERNEIFKRYTENNK